MKSISPSAEGFRTAFRRPSFTFAEIMWRWALGATLAAVFTFYGVEFLDTLPVTAADALLLATRQPFLMGRAVADILRGSLHRAVFGALVAALALALLWIIAASLGRLATTRAVLEHFRVDGEAGSGEESREAGGRFENGKRQSIRALIDLNFLRVAVVLAMMLALVGSAILSSLVSTEKNPRPDLAVVLFLLLTGVVFVAAWLLNWWLSFAAIFAVRNREDTLGAISAGATVVRTRTGAVLAVSTWTGVAHLVAFSIATSIATFLFAFIAIVPVRLVFVCVVLVMLAYFAVVDWLYIARLSGYICIAEMPDTPITQPDPVPRPIDGVNTAPEGTVDRNEPILSDVSNLALKS
jgi:hypothetical protein